MPDLAQFRTANANFDCNTLFHKALSPSRQHLMTEAPGNEKPAGRSYWKSIRIVAPMLAQAHITHLQNQKVDIMLRT